MFRQLLARVSQRLPSRCAVCHAWPAQAVCEACVADFAQPVPRCRSCARPVLAGMVQCGACITEPPPWDVALAALPYAYPWSRLVQEFKFEAHVGWANSFATLLRSAPWVEPALEACDLLIPMPLSRQRLSERGFNQCLELARALDARKTATHVLLRVQDTPAQSSLPRAQRLTSVRHAFAVDPMHAAALRDKRIVLLDDVMTTGASLRAAASVLRHAGAAHITVVVLARTQ